MMRVIKVLISFAFATIAFAQTPTLRNGAGSEVIVGAAGVKYDSTITTLTNSAALLTATKTYVQGLFCANTTGGAVTVTVTDNQGSPVTYVPTVSIAANGTFGIYFGAVGVPMQGIKWNASANSSINCQIWGVQ